MNISELWRKLHYFLNRRRIQRELSEEFEAHRAEMGDRAAGFGSNLKLREESNDAWGFGWLDRLWQDVHYGVRILRKSPAFTLTAITILALGIGLNVGAFGFLDVVALRPLPVKDPNTIVSLSRQSPSGSSSGFTYPSFDFYRRHNRVFSSMWGMMSQGLQLESGETIEARFVTPEFFAEMGQAPELGRFLEPFNTAPGSVVISHRFWQRQLGGDPTVVGRKIRLGQSTAVVAGVAPAKFVSVGPEDVDMWIPLTDQPLYLPDSKILTDTEAMSLEVYGRLLPGVSQKAAEDGLRPLVDAYRKVSPAEVWKDEYLPLEPGAYVLRLDEQRRSSYAKAAVLLFLVLAAACANLGNLLLARGAMRTREMGIRTAAGASRGRLVRQLLTESVLLALLGSAAGVPLSQLAISLLVPLSHAPETLDFTPDWRVGLFAFGAAMISAVLFGLAPAWHTSRPSANRASRTRLILVGAQVATSCILVILAGLMTRGLLHGLTANPGFSFEQSAVIAPGLYDAGIRGAAARPYIDQFRSRISQAPGVESIGLTTYAPFGGARSWIPHAIGNITALDVDGNYFATMQIPILQGRTFADREPATNIIIGKRVAERLWPGVEAIGKQFKNNKSEYTVIGVAANAPTIGFGDNDAMELYRPIQDEQLAFTASLVVRTTNIAASRKTLVQLANAGDGKIVAQVIPMREGFENRMRNARITTVAISALGGVALLVAIVGLAGLISYAVTQRTKEIGIRMALGARQAEAVRVGFAQLVRPVVIGLLIGIAAAAGLAQALRYTLYGLSPVDPIAYVSALALFASLVAMAAIPPLRRAARVDPATALRHD